MQVRSARNARGLSQAQLAKMTYVKRESISLLESGKHSPAVKIITDIAEALKTDFKIEGCTIGPSKDGDPTLRPTAVSYQLGLPFDLEHRFRATSLTVRRLPDNGIELRAVMSKGRRIETSAS